MQAPVIYVIAGVNGSGKSSVVGPYFNLDGLEIYNPDEEEKALRSRFPDKSKIEVNEIAWREGIRRLREAIKSNTRYAFETTLGGANTIPSLLVEAANKGHLVRVSYVGLESVELNLRRVRERVLKGGHAIPESKIRERWDNSRANLIRLLPYLDSLRLFDNSHEAAIA